MSNGREINRTWNEDGSPSTQFEQVTESAARGVVWDDLGRPHECFLINGKPVSKKKFEARVRLEVQKYEYIAGDGGPYVLLPAVLSNQWNCGEVQPYSSNYARARNAIENQSVAILAVGEASALILAGAPIAAWGIAPDGSVDIYMLHSWRRVDTDSLIRDAVLARGGSLRNSGRTLAFHEPDAYLFAEGGLGNASRIPIEAGLHQIRTADYRKGRESVTIYRMHLQHEKGNAPGLS